MKKIPGIPDMERVERGPVAYIECSQHIPCNPCEASCPQDAIHIGDDITNLPYLDGDKCIGCGICIAHCPGLSIFNIYKNFTDKTALVSFPYEYEPVPQKGMRVNCTDRMGNFVAEGAVTNVRNSVSFDHTAVVTVEIPKEYVLDIRGIERGKVKI